LLYKVLKEKVSFVHFLSRCVRHGAALSFCDYGLRPNQIGTKVIVLATRSVGA
jgi:hypothetical protein